MNHPLLEVVSNFVWRMAVPRPWPAEHVRPENGDTAMDRRRIRRNNARANVILAVQVQQRSQLAGYRRHRRCRHPHATASATCAFNSKYLTHACYQAVVAAPFTCVYVSAATHMGRQPGIFPFLGNFRAFRAIVEAEGLLGLFKVCRTVLLAYWCT